jgi:hypothetical protein
MSKQAVDKRQRIWLIENSAGRLNHHVYLTEAHAKSNLKQNDYIYRKKHEHRVVEFRRVEQGRKDLP